MTRRLGFVALALGLGWACTDEEKPPPPSGNVPDAGEGGDAGSGVSGSSVGGSSTGGSAGQGGSAGRGGQGGTRSGAGGADDAGGAGEGPGGVGTGGTGGPPPPCPSDPTAGSPPTATCDPEGMLGAAMDVPLGDAAASLLAITPDELTIAWFNSNVMGESFWVADRALATDAFGAGQQLVHDITFSAMSPDGLRLVALLPAARRSRRSRVPRGARRSRDGDREQFRDPQCRCQHTRAHLHRLRHLPRRSHALLPRHRRAERPAASHLGTCGCRALARGRSHRGLRVPSSWRPLQPTDGRFLRRSHAILR